MNRRFVLLLSLALAVSCSQKPPAPAPQAASPQGGKYNVVWIVLDACRAGNLSCYGNDRVTSPAIDALAARGVVLEQHFTQGLWTKLSVPSYMTGRYFPVSCLDFGGGINFPRDPAKGELLAPSIFHANGYRTALVTAQPYISPASRLYQAFDDAVFVKPEPGQPYAQFDHLMSDIVPRLQRSPGQPFFLHIHAMDTHFPHRHHVPPDDWARLDYASPYLKNGEPTQVTGCVFTEEDKRQLRGLHDASIRGADRSIAAIVSELARLGILEKTIVLVTSDHGDALGEDGTSWGHAVTFDEVMRVPLVIAGPGLPAGNRIRAFTEHVDLLPTLIDLCGLKTDAAMDGKDLMPLVREETAEPPHAYIVTRYTPRNYDAEPAFLVRDSEFKLDCDRVTGKSLLYRAPDTVAGRTLCASDAAETTARLRERIEKELMPKWHDFDALPKHYFMFSFTEEFVRASAPIEGVRFEAEGGLSEERCAGGRWLCVGGRLGAAPWTKEPPPLTFQVQVPPGRYGVGIVASSSDELCGHKASSAEVRVTDEPDFHRVTVPLSASGADAEQFRQVGVYDLRGKSVTVTVRTGEPQWWTMLNGIRFTALDLGISSTGSDPDAQQRDEQLRALGYLK